MKTETWATRKREGPEINYDLIIVRSHNFYEEITEKKK